MEVVNCPNCGHAENSVIRSRDRDDAVERTRECDECKHRWKTLEAPEKLIERAHEINEAFDRMAGAVRPRE